MSLASRAFFFLIFTFEHYYIVSKISNLGKLYLIRAMNKEMKRQGTYFEGEKT